MPPPYTAIRRCCLVLACLGRLAAGEIRLTDLPHLSALPGFAGEACVAMVLGGRGHAGDQAWVYDQAGLDPLRGRGCGPEELRQTMARIGFRPGPAAAPVTPAGAEAAAADQWRELLADLERGLPSIVFLREGDAADSAGRPLLVTGWRPATGEIIYHDPSATDGAGRQMPLADLLARWPVSAGTDHRSVVRLACAAGDLAIFTPATGHRPANYCQHWRRLAPTLPAGFGAVIERPFLILGDLPPDQLDRWTTGTVRWAVDQLRRTYFACDPPTILEIWLFRDRASYERNVLARWGRKPPSPYGYYSAADGALVMNIATGGGTLVHELVHPYMAANFPRCPNWFNEGMGSLYEQCTEREGVISGLTNWRLTGLQAALTAGELPTLTELLTADDFYDRRHGYAMARYLCLYLQERGLLQRFYREFTAAVEDDPDGTKTLRRVLAVDDLTEFQPRWEDWVAGLRFPPST
jgi:hypothetical protein